MIAAAPTTWWHGLPAVNATLNGTSAILLLAAYIAIKSRRVTTHAYFIIAALVTSTAFLACYLTYHAMKVRAGEVVTRFPPGTLRPVYLAILTSHTLLAIIVLPLVFTSVLLAWRRRWRLHRKVSVITWPVWMYVSITGVIVYWMLYHLAPALHGPA